MDLKKLPRAALRRDAGTIVALELRLHLEDLYLDSPLLLVPRLYRPTLAVIIVLGALPTPSLPTIVGLGGQL